MPNHCKEDVTSQKLHSLRSYNDTSNYLNISADQTSYFFPFERISHRILLDELGSMSTSPS